VEGKKKINMGLTSLGSITLNEKEELAGGFDSASSIALGEWNGGSLEHEPD